MDDMKIGGLHGELGLDVRGWFDGFEDAREALADFAKEVMSQFKDLEGSIRNVALGMSAAISVPFAGMAIVTKRGAGAFEKSMNNVHAALRGISGDQLVALSDAARRLGPEVGRSAAEAADGIETLGLAGMNATDILNGGLSQTLRLAAANAADLGQSAAVVTDVMAQFNKTSGDLERVVNNITGALDASKLGFNDFKDAIAQGGGVAGAAGVTFEDFNTSLAGTAALFGSGSDAGTSFKTFISALNGNSKEAKEMIKRLGLEFYDTATGKMRPMADIADQLSEKLGNLSDRSRTDVLSTIFGSDAMRTAIGLMRLGGQSFEDLQRTIGQTDAGEKLAIQLQGVEASSQDLSNSFDELKIALGETGILAAFTAVQNALSSMVRTLAELPLWFRTVVVAIWGVAAAAGPMILALMGIVKVIAPIVLLTGAFGTFGAILGVLLNPLGAVVAVLGRLIFALSGTNAALMTLGYTMSIWAGGIGLAVTALTLLVLWVSRTATASSAATQAAQAASDAYARQQQEALKLVSATGEARKAIIEKMKVDRAAALQAMEAARADGVAALKALARARANLALAKSTIPNPGSAGAVGNTQIAPAMRAVQEQEATVTKLAEALNTRVKSVEDYTRNINSPEFGTVDLNFDKADAGKTAKGSGPSAQELANRREQMKLEQQMAVARARDDKDEMRRIQDKLDILQRQRDYEDAGLSVAAARTAAAKDIAEIKAAEAEFDAREIAQAENALDQQLAEIRGDEQMARYAADKAYLEERTTFWQGKGLTILQAQKRAAEDLVQVDIARADAAAKVATQQALEREAELSRIRGDSAAKQRAAAREAEAARRTEQYYRDGEGKVTEEDARDRANRELDEEERARQQGQWRDTFKGAMRAALDGDLGGFVKNWWKDQVSRGLEEALNSLTDMLFNMFRQAMGQAGGASGGGGGGIFGAIMNGIGAIGGVRTTSSGGLGGVSTSSQSYLNGLSASLAVPKNLPGFATGGSFEIGGAPGIDTNLVQFWGTAGETVDIRRGNNDNDGGGNIYHITGNVLTPEMWAQIQAMDGMASAQAVGTTERRAARRSRRRMGR
ncbi:phage tail tape measure protein [Sphingobium cupriresistens]|uniref:Phage tail tape measure protein domain-containing protein n=1 Tax=Sphingobium cupriresistens LL01 TaxID=1420583 RepID=A0A0J7XUI9_9SPHN|nr:phage tail tape measure protein [Sphingobium cupriresistens]KMS54723.1 hypothetical protein V473_15405 [Sphingobium cupriresistens LL01]